MFKHLLVPLDGSELAEVALPMATAVAEKFGSQITLVTAVHLPYYIGDGLDYAEVYSSLSDNVTDEARAYLQSKQKALRTAGFQVNFELLVGQPPAEAILIIAEEKAVDAIVMSTHGRGGDEPVGEEQVAPLLCHGPRAGRQRPRAVGTLLDARTEHGNGPGADGG